MAAELETLALSVKRLQYRHHRALDVHLAKIGSSLAQWDALRAIGRAPDASTHDLALATFQTDQSFGALANRIAARGLVERIAGPGRAVRHRLTPAGEEVLRQGSEVVRAVLARSFSPLSEQERGQLAELVARLIGGPDLI